MKKIISIIVAVMLIAGSLSACSDKQNSDNKQDSQSVSDNSGTKKLKIVTTIFPEYDWVRTILGENADQLDLTMLLDNGVDLHSYQPTAEDIAKISTCDMFVYVGGESDEWVDDALKEATNKDMVVINLLDVLGDDIKEEEVVEGMEAEDEHEEGEEHEHEDGEEHEEGEEVEYDEHVWLSVRNAKLLCSEICNACVKTLQCFKRRNGFCR